ncbi:MAG TPA: MerR family transcriptional regulator [Flavisolibacter sp.]|nr:MerR family transcriptional regulator [Flavisolibacter sp.]
MGKCNGKCDPTINDLDYNQYFNSSNPWDTYSIWLITYSFLFLYLFFMDKPLPQITFDFFSPPPEEEKPKEFLSGQPVPQEKPVAPKSNRGRKALKDIEAEIDLVEVPEDEVLFQKQYYSIGEVANMFKVNTSLIRFWENEFDILEPRKNRKGDRFFKPVDVKNLQMIHDLLRRRKFTIEGAKDFLKKNKQGKEKYEMVQSLQKLRSFLLQLKANL